MVGFIREEVKNKRSQDLGTYYRLNGAIYICEIKELLENRSFFTDDAIYAYTMSAEHSVDIDTQIDFFTASAIFQNRQVNT